MLLSFVAAFLAASYPFTKRFFAIPQAYLGIAFGFGIPMAYAAQLGARARRRLGAAAAPTSSGPSPTTPSTRWSTATTTCKIGIRTSAILFGRFDVARRHAVPRRVPGAAGGDRLAPAAGVALLRGPGRRRGPDRAISTR